MGDGPHLELYGGVHWSWQQTRWAAPAGKPSTILAVLADADGPRSGDSLIDVLWPDDPPRSGHNALRRHISRIRAQFRQRFDDEIDPIVRTAGGYGLNELVTTDLDAMADILVGRSPSSHPGKSGAPRWWEEPLAGLPWEPFDILRHRLRQLSRSVVVEQSERAIAESRYLDATRMLEGMTAAFPGDRELWLLTIEAAQRCNDQQLLDALANRLRRVGPEDDNAELVAMSADLLVPRKQYFEIASNDTIGGIEEAAAAWLMGETSAAIRTLQSSADIEHDVARRTERIFRSHKPTNGLSRQILSEMIGTRVRQRPSAERAFVALDARALATLPNGIDIARRESNAARSPSERVRALRVEFFLRLGVPLSQRATDIVGELSTIDEPDAAVESHRFELILAARRGEFARTLQLLDDYDQIVRNHWPGHDCAFADLGRLALSLHPGLSALGIDVRRPSQFPELVSDRSTAELAQLYSHLCHEEIDRQSTIEIIVRDAAANLPPESATAIGMLWMLATDRAREASQKARKAAADLRGLRGDGYNHFLPVVVAEVALRTDDRTLATAAFQALEPFAEEELGLWPLDLLFGPCDNLLSRLER